MMLYIRCSFSSNIQLLKIALFQWTHIGKCNKHTRHATRTPSLWFLSLSSLQSLTSLLTPCSSTTCAATVGSLHNLQYNSSHNSYPHFYLAVGTDSLHLIFSLILCWNVLLSRGVTALSVRRNILFANQRTEGRFNLFKYGWIQLGDKHFGNWQPWRWTYVLWPCRLCQHKIQEWLLAFSTNILSPSVRTSVLRCSMFLQNTGNYPSDCKAT